MGRSKFTYDLIMKFYKLFKNLDNWGLIKHDESEDNTFGNMIPINEVVRMGKNVVLPMEILNPIIERADNVLIMTECLCRRGEGCASHPIELGCLLLGSAGLDLGKGMGREVTVAEAVTHAKNAIKLGLFPLVVHNEFDAWLWGIDYGRMLNVCFCCDCCCAVRHGLRTRQSDGFFNNIKRLPGLTVFVGKDCIGCGKCVEVCVASAMDMVGNVAVVNDANCKGCGNCVEVCPENAITMSIEKSVDVAKVVIKAYEERADVGPLSAIADED